MSAHGAACLISVDWGTTSLRCVLVGAGGTVLQQRRAERGILKTGGQPFGDILHAEIEPFLGQVGNGERVPVLMSGMIGSRQGWQEAAYLRCPASPRDLAQHLLVIDTAGTALAGCDVRIVPGMDIGEDVASGVLPDVMRGEETQVLGALVATDLQDGIFVLPGTHSKWVRVEAGTIAGFRTFMTGEVFAALLDATIIGRLAASDDDPDSGFARGVATAERLADRSGPGDLLNMVFSARSLVLHGEMAETAVRGYLSGLLIGSEILSGADSRTGATNVQIIGEDALQKRYMAAGSLLARRIEPAIDNPAPIAHLAIARLAGLVA